MRDDVTLEAEPTRPSCVIPPRGAKAARLRRRRGFTVIEMVVVIALVAIAVGAVVISVANTRRANLKSAAGKMSAMARYLYNRAIIDSRPYRLVVDMNDGLFWGEAMVTDDACSRYVPSADEEEREAERKRREKIRERRATRTGLSDDKGDEDGQEDPSANTAFSLLRDQLLRPRKLPAQVIVSGVQLSYQDKRQTEGRAAIHFWPTGNADRALIWWAERSTDEDANEDGYLTVLTLEVEALTGRVKRHNEALSDEFIKRERTL